MAINIKIGGDILTDVDVLQVENADDAGTYIDMKPGMAGGYTVTAMAVEGGASTKFSEVAVLQGNPMSQPASPVGKTIASYYSDSAMQTPISFPHTPSADEIIYGKVVVALPTLNDNSWDTISQISALGTGSSFWSVGDVKQITLNGTAGSLSLSNVNTYVFILGFNHNSAIEGNGITFGGFKWISNTNTDLALADSGYNTSKYSGTWFNMNNSQSNTNGWKGCHMRYYALGSTNADGADAGSTTATDPVANTLMSCLPSDLRAVMKPMTIYSDNTGGGSDTASYVTATVDYLPLLAEFEVFGAKTGANSNEKNFQAQYDYYKNGKSKIRYRSDAPSTAGNWWLRSVSAAGNSAFCSVYTSGSASVNSAGYSYGAAPAFRI